MGGQLSTTAVVSTHGTHFSPPGLRTELIPSKQDNLGMHGVHSAVCRRVERLPVPHGREAGGVT